MTTSTDQTTKLPGIIYTPADVAQLTIRTIEAREANSDSGVTMGIDPSIDDVIKPIRAGDLVTILALSSHWKTGFMLRQARRVAAALDPAGDEAVVYCTWETSVEEMGMIDLANMTHIPIDKISDGKGLDWFALKKAAMQRGAMPLYIIGHSMERRKARPKLSIDMVAKAILYLRDTYKVNIKLLCFDYLQRMDFSLTGAIEPRLQYAHTVNAIKDLAIFSASPVYLGCQAKQEIMERHWKLPRMNDGMETSAIMHASDKIIGLWRPVVTEGRTGTIGGDGDNKIPVSDDLLILGIAKQRYGDVGYWWPLKVNFPQGEIQGIFKYDTISL